MDDRDHFLRLTKYFESSRLVYDLLLGGAKHLGYHPEAEKVSEKKAQLLMHELIAEKINLTASMVVLDAGCGQGIVSTYLANKYGCTIHGISMVPFEIERANKLARMLGLDHKVKFSLMDYSNMSFSDEYFDAIYSIESLVHSTNLRKSLQEFYRVLKSNGRVSMFEYCLEDESKLRPYEKKILQAVAYASSMTSLTEFRVHNIQKLLHDLKFNVIDTKDITENVRPSVLRLKRFFDIPYFFIKVLGMQARFPNLTGVVEFARMGRRRVFGYRNFTFEKTINIRNRDTLTT